MCKWMGATQATCVFFSSFSIVMIAVDRYVFIVHSNRTQTSIKQALTMSMMSLLLSIILSSPLFIITQLDVSQSLFSDKLFSYCYESWGSHPKKQFYTLACLLTQYVVPCVVVGTAYVRYGFILSFRIILAPFLPLHQAGETNFSNSMVI